MLLDHAGRKIDPAAIEAIRRTGEDRYPALSRVPGVGVTKAGVVMSPDRGLQVSAVWGWVWGNGYAEVEFAVGGRQIALWPIHRSRVWVMRDVETEELIYRVDNNQEGPTYLDQWSVFHLRGPGEDVVGLAVS